MTKKSTYVIDEPIEVEVRRVNNDTIDTFIINRLFLNHNVDLEVLDENGELYLFDQWNIKMTVVHPRDITELVKLEPGHFFGILDVTEGRLCINRPGTYRITVSITYDPGIKLAQQLNLNYDSQPAFSNEVHVLVRACYELGMVLQCILSMETSSDALELARPSYPSDVSDEEWSFVSSYLVLMNENAPQRVYRLREMFNALRWIVRAGAAWRLLPTNFPPWHTVYGQTQRWIKAGVFEDIVDDVRATLREALGKNAQPTAAIVDAQTLRSTPESGGRAGFDAGKLTKGSKVHIAVDTLGNLLALTVTPANQQERTQVGQLLEDVQAVTGDNVTKVYADSGYCGEPTANVAKAHGVDLEIVKVPDAVRGFVLLPKRWIVERSFAWKTRFRRLVKDYERLPETVAGLHFVVFAILMLARLVATKVASA